MNKPKENFRLSFPFVIKPRESMCVVNPLTVVPCESDFISAHPVYFHFVTNNGAVLRFRHTITV
jgi:hypothetical protein